jgi:hypothetical protein
MRGKIGILIIFFSRWPDWIYSFVFSCERNPDIDFIFINDSQTVLSDSKNIKNINFTIDDFNALASEKLGFGVQVNNPYKICDFKPALGKIFEDYLTNYDYWGVSDIDLIFGDLSSALKEILYNKYDLVSFYKEFISAPFFLVRNTAYLNSIFEQINDYKKYLSLDIYCGLDENNKQERKRPGILKRVMNILKFIFINTVNVNFLKLKNAELKYNLHWFLKKAELSIPGDFTETVHLLSGQKKITSLFLDYMESDKSFNRKGIIQWRVEYRNGRIYETSHKKEMLLFHFLESKRNLGFKISNDITSGFLVTNNGITGYG